MKLSRLLPAIAAAALPLLAHGQSPTPTPAPAAAPSPAPAVSPHPGPATDAASGVPLPDQPSGPVLDKPMQLMPGGAAPDIPKPKGSGEDVEAAAPDAQSTPKLDPSNTFEAEKLLHERIRLRQLYTHVLNDPETQYEWDAAHKAKTDPERRQLLTVYYTHLYDKMAKMDPSLAESISDRKASALWRLKYPRLEGDDNQEPVEAPGAPEQPGVPPRQ